MSVEPCAISAQAELTVSPGVCGEVCVNEGKLVWRRRHGGRAGFPGDGTGTPPPGLAPFGVVAAKGIPTIPAPLSGKPGDAKDGEKVVIERRLGNCLSCHEIGALSKEPFHGEIGPSLDGVAQRWDAATLRMIVVNAKKVFGDETVCRRSIGSTDSTGCGRNSSPNRY